MHMRRLSDAQRELAELVSQATSCNPFTEQRTGLDRRIAGRAAATDSETSELAVSRVAQAVRELASDGGDDIRVYDGAERPLVRTLLLFNVYHAYREAFDDLIVRQVEAGASALPVPFADECLARMQAHGFAREESLRAFAAFFQLRRAFFFIYRGLIGRSASMRMLRTQLWNNVFTHDFLRYEELLWNRMEDFSTLLLGETGTGKGAAAAAIGRSGFIPFNARTGSFAQSFGGIFVAANLSAYAESLIESELFGHRKGAFTGAIDAHEGVFGRCPANGAIFLDEIGDLRVPVQIKLLRVLQERTFTPVGSHENRRFSGRVIAATNKPLPGLLGQGGFREDFYYRLCSDQILVPPLRRRLQEDSAELEDLVAHVLERLCGRAGIGLAGQVCASLRHQVGTDYSWPGNVRELEQAVRRTLLTGGYEPGLTVRSAEDAGRGVSSALADCGMTARDLLRAYCGLLYERTGSFAEVARRTGLDRRTVTRYCRDSSDA